MNIRDWWKIEQSKDASLPNEIPEVIMRAWMTGEEFGRDRSVKVCDEQLRRLNFGDDLTGELPREAIDSVKWVKRFIQTGDDPNGRF